MYANPIENYGSPVGAKQTPSIVTAPQKRGPTEIKAPASIKAFKVALELLDVSFCGCAGPARLK